MAAMSEPTARRLVEEARTPLARMRGLLGRAGLPPGHALLLTPCSAIHTLGMRFGIDVRFYDREGRLTRTVEAVRPGRWLVWGGWRAYCALECAAGDPAFSGCATLEEARKPC